jgi:octaprenyl-diphosphate synthase
LITLLGRLSAQEREELVGEVLGQRPSQLVLRSQQMSEFGVFEAVVKEIHHELRTATDALQNWSGEAPTPLLIQLCEVLRNQVAALQWR